MLYVCASHSGGRAAHPPGHSMSTDATDAGSIARVDAMSLDDGRVILYDRTNDDAWVQADHAVEVPRD